MRQSTFEIVKTVIDITFFGAAAFGLYYSFFYISFGATALATGLIFVAYRFKKLLGALFEDDDPSTKKTL